VIIGDGGADLYRTGDGEKTGLLGGRRVRKSVLRVEAYGELDELNACLGLAATTLTDADTVELLILIQRQIFASALAWPTHGSAKRRGEGRVSGNQCGGAGARYRRGGSDPAPLKSFVILEERRAARLHVARTVCRRAERRLVALAAQEDVPPVFLAYLNRLSDLLFVLHGRRITARRSDIRGKPGLFTSPRE